MPLSVPDSSKKLLIFIIFLFFGFEAYSQSTDWDEYNKYWYYRYQLVSEFLVRGEESPLNPGVPGTYSIPAEGAFSRGYDLWWVDGTMHLGWYISVLATEYKLLSMNHQPTE